MPSDKSGTKKRDLVYKIEKGRKRLNINVEYKNTIVV